MSQQIAVTIRKGDQPLERQMFQTGFSFHEAALRCADRVDNGAGGLVSPTSPMIACYAMAAELYLKSLSVIEFGKSIQSHRLNVLFAKLKPETVKSVEEKFLEIIGAENADIQKILPTMSAAFVEWRYIFEDEGGRNIPLNALVAFVRALYLEIRARKPDWPVGDYLDTRFKSLPIINVATVISVGGGTMVQAIIGPPSEA